MKSLSSRSARLGHMLTEMPWTGLGSITIDDYDYDYDYMLFFFDYDYDYSSL